MRAVCIVSLCLTTFVTTFVATSTALAQAPVAPPSPAASAPTAVLPTAWACTKKTLLDDVPCTIEGKTIAQAASKEGGKEHQRQAKALADDVCRALARGGEPDEDGGLLGVCTARMSAATKKCGGDGARRLLDDDGRFNPGHTRCYGALAGVVRDMVALAETSSTCCACIADQCGGNGGKCVERIGDGNKPDASAQCLSNTCAGECAVLQLTTRKP